MPLNLQTASAPHVLPTFHCFDLRYRVNLSGTVSMLSRQIVPLDRCSGMEDYE